MLPAVRDNVPALLQLDFLATPIGRRYLDVGFPTRMQRRVPLGYA